MCLMCLQKMFGPLAPTEAQFSIVESKYESGGPKGVAHLLLKSLDNPPAFAAATMSGFHLMGLDPNRLEQFMAEFQEGTKGESESMKSNFSKTFGTVFNTMSKAALTAHFFTAMQGAHALGVAPKFALAATEDDPSDPDAKVEFLTEPVLHPAKNHLH